MPLIGQILFASLVSVLIASCLKLSFSEMD